MEHLSERPRERGPSQNPPPNPMPETARAPLDEAHFRRMADRAPVMIWACDAHGGHTFFNQQWVAFTGLPLESLLHAPWLMDIHPDDYGAYRQQFLAAFQERVEFRVEYRLRRCDGRYRWLIDTGVPMHDEHERFVGYIGNCVDITDRKVMEEALAHSERKFKLLFDLSADAQMLLDGERVVDCNAATVAMFQVTDRWAIIGREAAEFLPGPLDGRERATLPEMIATALSRQSHRFEWSGLRSRDVDGAVLPVEVLLTNVPTNGRPLVHAVIRDLTAQHQLEASLRQSHKMEAIGTLAGGIAHDFNNLLAAIMGYTELAVLDAGSGSPAARNLSEALTAARRARDLVRQILTFSRHDEAKRTDIDIARVVHESARLLRASIPATVDIRVRAERGCVINGNAVQIQQVLLNLGANAEHAMRETGGGLFEVVLSREDLDEGASPGVAPGPVARLVVRDTGKGMPEHVRDRVFDPFFTTKPIGEGTGMGLAVVHGIVTAHGGTISVESAPGAGTTFTIVLPTSSGASASDTAPHRVSKFPTGQGRVLVVEDEPALGRMFRRLLMHLGYEAEVFENARDALACFVRDPDAFDVVITDLTMPGMTGDALASEVLRLRPATPVILATGYGASLSTERVRSLGIASVLRKPLTMSELGEALRAVVPAASTAPKPILPGDADR